MASNFLVALESAAERVAGVDRELLAPLVRAAVETWAAEGDAALTGPIARGDEATVARHREAIAERAPELLGLYDALAEATRAVAARAASDGAELTAHTTTSSAAARRSHDGAAAPASTTPAPASSASDGAGAPA
jgi:predicted short-subunit dehydrogenase-like oxidoreductase (DUF2520 family)